MLNKKLISWEWEMGINVGKILSENTILASKNYETLENLGQERGKLNALETSFSYNNSLPLSVPTILISFWRESLCVGNFLNKH